MILAIVPDASRAESLLNSLSEADFDLKDVSVVMQDVKTRNTIAKDAGPLKGRQPADLASALQALGVSKENAQRCADAMSKGKVVVAMKVDPKYDSAARQTFADHAAEIVQG